MGTFYIAAVAESASFAELLNGFVRRFGSQTALGKAIDISASRLSRVMAGQHSLEVVNCLRLAEVTGESPSVVLRAAGKGDVADLIERMYGAARPALAPSLSPAQRDLIDDWQALPADVRGYFAVLIAYAREVASAGRAEGMTAVPAARRRRRPATPRTRSARRGDAKP